MECPYYKRCSRLGCLEKLEDIRNKLEQRIGHLEYKTNDAGS
jgi:hypothetical protein